MNDVASSIFGDNVPSPGDLMMCFGCYRIMAFKEDMTFRELTALEMAKASRDPRMQLVRGALYRVKSFKDKY
jgi:hypothetical protein